MVKNDLSPKLKARSTILFWPFYLFSSKTYPKQQQQQHQQKYVQFSFTLPLFFFFFFANSKKEVFCVWKTKWMDVCTDTAEKCHINK